MNYRSSQRKPLFPKIIRYMRENREGATREKPKRKMHEIERRTGCGRKGVALAAVQQCHPAVVTATTAVETVIKNPLLSILEFNSDKAQSPRYIGCPLFDYPPQSPGGKPPMEDPISHAEIDSGVSHTYRPSKSVPLAVHGLTSRTDASSIEFDPFAFVPIFCEPKTTDLDNA